MAQEKLLANTRRNLSKAQIAARKQAEELVVTNATVPKPSEIIRNNPPMKKLFNRVKKYNDHFTEADSIALSTLSFNLHLKHINETQLAALDVTDDECERYLLRLDKLDRKINDSMKQLCIPLNSRLSLANDMAKIMLEEKKLQQMNNEGSVVNPLLALLEDDDE